MSKWNKRTKKSVKRKRKKKSTIGWNKVKSEWMRKREKLFVQLFSSFVSSFSWYCHRNERQWRDRPTDTRRIFIWILISLRLIFAAIEIHRRVCPVPFVCVFSRRQAKFIHFDSFFFVKSSTQACQNAENNFSCEGDLAKQKYRLMIRWRSIGREKNLF